MNSAAGRPAFSAPPWVERKRFDADQYQAMAAAGILAADEAVELIDGEIVTMSPMGSRHARAVMKLTHLFVTASASDFEVFVQCSIRLGSESEPEPDLALFHPGAGTSDPDVPLPGSRALLLIEVADTTLRYDRDVKLPLYARHGVPETWIVDLNGRAIEVYRAPAEGAYAQSFVVRDSDPVASIALPDLRITADDLGP